MSGKADRNLIVGLMAFQLEYVEQNDLLKCMSQWMHNKGKKLEDILLENQLIDRQRHTLLGQLAESQYPFAADTCRTDAVPDKEPGPEYQAVESDTERTGWRHPDELAALCSELDTLPDSDIAHSLSVLSRVAKDKQPSPSQDLYETLEESSNPEMGARRFRILRPHARGGLGEVSIAQDDELKRQVALKEIRRQYADDAAARARFVLEAEVTGGLEHPGVVPVYGMGVGRNGRPFYAMRFIRGDSLQEAAEKLQNAKAHSAYTAEQSLGIRKLLHRFVNVCQTIEYAHSRGILHRDLKPDNILLGPYGETLVVDWGLAKTIDGVRESTELEEPILQPLSGSGVAQTEMGSVVGTPAFMSPEQAAGRPDKIGPGSDVYSLGATLFFLLSGKTPLDASRSQERDSVDVGRALQRVAKGNLISVEKANPRIANGYWKPIANICSKAMSLRIEDRYSSAADMAEDIERFLADEEIEASPDPWLKRAQRWIRRHQTFATTATAIIFVSSVGLLIFSAQLRSKQRELEQSNADLLVAKDDAFQAAETADEERRAAELARNQAMEAEADQSAYADFLVNNILATARPAGQFGGLGINVKVVDALRVAEQEIPRIFSNRPLAEAIASQGIGETWLNLGEFDRAIVLLERASELFLSEGSAEDERYLVALSSLATAKSQNGDVDAGVSLQKHALSTFLRTHGPNDPKTLTAQNNLALSFQRAGQYDQAIELLQKVLAGRNKLHGEQDPLTLESRMNLAGVLRLLPNGLDEAKQIYDEILPGLQAALGELHPVTLKAVNNRATLYQELGDNKESIASLESLLEKMETQLGESHPTTLVTLSNLAKAFQDNQQLDDALRTHQDAFSKATKALGEDHPTTLNAEDLLGSCYDSRGDLETAAEHYLHVWTLRKEVLGLSHPDTLSTANNLAMAYDLQGNTALAVPIFEQVLSLRRELFDAGDTELNTALNNMAAAYSNAGRFRESSKLYSELLNLLPEDAEPIDRWRVQNNLADAYTQLGEAEAAREMLQALREEMLAILGEDETNSTPIPANLALARYNLGEYEEAQKVLLALCEWQRKRPEPEFRSTLRGMLVYLALSELQLGKFAQAENSARESFELAKELLAADDWRSFNAQSILGEALLKQDNISAAKQTLTPAHDGLLSQMANIPPPLVVEFLGASFDRMITLARLEGGDNDKVEELVEQRAKLLTPNN